MAPRKRKLKSKTETYARKRVPIIVGNGFVTKKWPSSQLQLVIFKVVVNKINQWFTNYGASSISVDNLIGYHYQLWLLIWVSNSIRKV